MIDLPRLPGPLASDVVISFNGLFANFSTGDTPSGMDRTSYLFPDNKPRGGNILFLDGHVAWRPFTAMKIRGGPNDLWF